MSTEPFTLAVSRVKNWKASRPDYLHGYWIKRFSAVHKQLQEFYNDFLTGKTAVDLWLLQGCTTLIIKSSKRGPTPSINNLPPTLWKLFSFILNELIYGHLEEKQLLPVEQKGCQKR